MMKDLTSPAGYSRIHTNYSVRATAITLWANGLTNWEIMVISGNRNESSLQNYCMPSVQQLCKCSNILIAALGDDKVQPTTANQFLGNERKPPLQQLQVPSINTVIFFHSRMQLCSVRCSVHA